MKYIPFLFLLMLASGCNREPTTFPIVRYAGEMRNITERDDTTSHIFLDSINPHQHLYGLGPLAGMSGEILIIDGRPYASKINRKRLNKIRQTYLVKSPYFVYTHVRGWDKVELPETVYSDAAIASLIEGEAQKTGIDLNKPFPFLIKGTFDKLGYNISYRAKKNKKNKPDPNTSFVENDQNAVVLGFYSKNHEGIFTKPGSRIVMSFMTTDATQIGQIDQLTFNGKKVQLLLPR